MINKIQITNCQYLSQFIDKLPSHCLINKGITGCGGTTLELQSKRNSIILCPTKNLVASKVKPEFLGVTGETTNKEIKDYAMGKGDKKIIATYDALSRLMELIPDYQNYFLLIDEYHLLFNDYSFRSEPIMFILHNYSKFKDWAFMTATPLKEEFILEELKDVEQIIYEWNNSVPVKITILDTYFVQKELYNIISTEQRNLHIFLNSVSTISKIADKLDPNSFRVVCSNKSKVRNSSKITDPVKKINFYTSCAFEGCDIYDPEGLCIIVSDTNISTTVLDITTKVRQVCGRLRDSKYKDEVILLLNTTKHRYAGTSYSDFISQVQESERLGRIKSATISRYSEDELLAELRTYNKESYSNIYLNKFNNHIFFDENLKKLDIYNYKLISEIYSSSITVMKEIENTELSSEIQTSKIEKGLSWIISTLKELDKSEYTYSEIEEIFKPLFALHNLVWNKNTSIKNYFPEFIKKQKTVNKKREIYYRFK